MRPSPPSPQPTPLHHAHRLTTNNHSNLTILFAVYASHKALSSPPSPQTTALLVPWLTYFLVLALAHVAESYIPLIGFLPLYAWARLFVHVYLLLPGNTQGAAFLYTSYLLPFIREHERDIETLIADVHGMLRTAGLAHIEDLIEYIRVQLLGGAPARRDHAAEAAAAPPGTTNSYVAGLLGRFAASSLPASATPPAASGLSALLGSALAQASSSLGSATSAPSRGAPDALLPAHLSTDRERLTYIARQREHLRTLLGAYDREEQTIHLAGAGSDGMGRSRSEAEFETIRSEDVGGAEGEISSPGGAGWGTWLMGKGKEAARSSGADVPR